MGEVWAPASASVRPLKELERAAVLEALAAFQGRKPEAAKALGIGLKTLYYKIKKYGLPTRYGMLDGQRSARRVDAPPRGA